LSGSAEGSAHPAGRLYCSALEAGASPLAPALPQRRAVFLTLILVCGLIHGFGFVEFLRVRPAANTEAPEAFIDLIREPPPASPPIDRKGQIKPRFEKSGQETPIQRVKANRTAAAKASHSPADAIAAPPRPSANGKRPVRAPSASSPALLDPSSAANPRAAVKGPLRAPPAAVPSTPEAMILRSTALPRRPPFAPLPVARALAHSIATPNQVLASAAARPAQFVGPPAKTSDQPESPARQAAPAAVLSEAAKSKAFELRARKKAEPVKMAATRVSQNKIQNKINAARAERDRARALELQRRETQKAAAAAQAERRAEESRESQAKAARAALHYRAQVYARIIARELYPQSALSQGAHGSVRVRFEIGSTGALAALSIQASSGDRTLDAAAISAVRHAAPFPAPPEGAPHVFVAPIFFRAPRSG
jgi:periplasmic protein TonB